jgi:hypothetical protein
MLDEVDPEEKVLASVFEAKVVWLPVVGFESVGWPAPFVG